MTIATQDHYSLTAVNRDIQNHGQSQNHTIWNLSRLVPPYSADDYFGTDPDKYDARITRPFVMPAGDPLPPQVRSVSMAEVPGEETIYRRVFNAPAPGQGLCRFGKDASAANLYIVGEIEEGSPQTGDLQPVRRFNWLRGHGVAPDVGVGSPDASNSGAPVRVGTMRTALQTLKGS
ncbi:hypothetical protein LZ30DRAFT_693244 [Colletotrichum cereale]|nr:hypothetical protein LZ30DRAFT_693244 [Colletotrichum cereale]